MSQRSTYTVIMSSRNGGSLLKNTLESLKLQTIPPEIISIVIDGGEVDSTLKIVERNCKPIPYLIIEHRGAEYAQRDVRRMPSNLNEAYKATVNKIKQIDFILISGDDCHYPQHYAETLMQYMLRDQLVVSSGICDPFTPHPLREVHPSGAGRMIDHDYWYEIGATFPISYGWETWLIYKAEMNGEKVRVYSDLQFKHLHPRGRTHQFYHWGKARYLLGFHPIYMLGRIILDLTVGGSTIPKSGALKMLVGYVAAPILFKLKTDPYALPLVDIKKFVHEKQLTTIRKRITALIK